MSNMTHCRFRNTSKDLVDCQEALEDLIVGDGQPLSREEFDAAMKLICTCIDIVEVVADAGGVEVDTGSFDTKLRAIMTTLNNREYWNNSEEERT